VSEPDREGGPVTLPSPSGRRVGDEGAKRSDETLFDLWSCLVTDNLSSKNEEATLSPHPDPLPKGEGVKRDED